MATRSLSRPQRGIHLKFVLGSVYIIIITFVLVAHNCIGEDYWGGSNSLPIGENSWRLDATCAKPAYVSMCVKGPAIITFNWRKSTSYSSGFNLIFRIQNTNGETILERECPIFDRPNPEDGYVPDDNIYKLTWEYMWNKAFTLSGNQGSSAFIRDISLGNGTMVQCSGTSSNSTTYVDKSNSDPHKYRYKFIEEAIKHCKPFGTVYVIAGTDPYFLNKTVEIDKPLNLIGYGRITPIIQSSNKEFPIINSTANEVKIENLELIGGKSGIYLNQTLGNIIDNIAISNCIYGIFLTSSHHSKITNNTLKGFAISGIVLDNSTNSNISCNNVTSDGSIKDTNGISMRNTGENLLDKNNITNIDVGIRLVHLLGGDNITESNKFNNDKYCDVLGFQCELSKLIYPKRWNKHEKDNCFFINSTNITGGYP